MNEGGREEPSNRIVLLTCRHRSRKYLFFEGWRGRQWWFLRPFCCLDDPVFACMEVKFVTSVIIAVHSAAVRADEIELRV